MSTLHFLAQYKNDQINIQSVAQALASVDRIFSIKRIYTDGDIMRIQTPDKSLVISVAPYRVHQAVQAFDVEVHCAEFEQLEYMRYWVAEALKIHTKADSVFLVSDGVSERIAASIYPQLHQVETRLRRYLIRFFLRVVGDQWLKATAPRDVIDKVTNRMARNRDKWDQLLVNDLYYMDFYELGLLITRQSTGFNDYTQIVGRVQSITTIEELEELQRDMESNYTKYFRDTFMQHQFHRLWQDLYQIRNRVAHNSILTSDDLTKVLQSVAQLNSILDAAEARMSDVELTREEEFLIEDQQVSDVPADESVPDFSDLLPKLTILGKIDIPETRRKDKPAEDGSAEAVAVGMADAADGADAGPADDCGWIIDEGEFLDALDEYSTNPKYDQSRFLALSTMLNMLEEEGYNRESCRRMAFQLERDRKVEIYDYSDKFALRSCKAIRRKKE